MIRNEIEAQGLSSPNSTRIFTVLRYISGPNWETNWNRRGFSYVQPQNVAKFDLNLTLKVKGNHPTKR